MAAKILLSRLPVDYGFWRRISLFRHGRMEDPAYAHRVFLRHYQRYLAAGGRATGYSVLELGPGDSLNTALIARTYCADEVILLDTVAAAHRDLEPYRTLLRYLKSACHAPPVCALKAFDSLDAMLEHCRARYFTGGLDSLRRLPAHSVDFVFSQAVLEHVRRAEIGSYFLELHRILHPGGIMSHRIDFKDHLGNALNSLRFPSRYWESSFLARSGFYTNRLRASEILEMLRTAGFECHVIHEDRWTQPPIKRSCLAEEFSDLTDNDLSISGFDVICRRRESTA